MNGDVDPNVTAAAVADTDDGTGRTGSQTPKQRSRKVKEPKVREPRVGLSLRDYFADPALPAPAFLKAVADDMATRLPEDVLQDAERLRVDRDRDHRRLLALTTQPMLPPALAGWVWQTVLKVVQARAPAAFDPYDLDVEVQLRRLLREVDGEVGSEVPEVRQAATNILLLGLAWMTTQRRLTPAAAVQILSDALAEADRMTEVRVRRILTSGRLPDVQRAIAVTRLMSGRAKEIAGQRDQEKALRVATQERLDASQERLALLEDEVARLRAEAAGLSEQVATSRAELESSRQHWGHDMTEVRTRHSSLLRNKVIPSLSDAVDALEIEPAEPGIALRRIRSVLSTLRTEEG